VTALPADAEVGDNEVMVVGEAEVPEATPLVRARPVMLDVANTRPATTALTNAFMPTTPRSSHACERDTPGPHALPEVHRHKF